jgi:hypothetical protein
LSLFGKSETAFARLFYPCEGLVVPFSTESPASLNASESTPFSKGANLFAAKRRIEYLFSQNTASVFHYAISRYGSPSIEGAGGIRFFINLSFSV